MPQINDNYLKLKAGYLFPEIGRRVNAFARRQPDAKVIRLGIGDVTEPLPPAVIKAMQGRGDMARRETSRLRSGTGYDFLRNAIVENEFSRWA